LHKRYAQILLSKFSEVDPNLYFRIHPKGTGVICIDPQGIAAQTVIAEYLGELYPPYRWCEKLDAIQQAQQKYELKPNLPDFYNILLERPRKDERGYGISSLFFPPSSPHLGHQGCYSLMHHKERILGAVVHILVIQIVLLRLLRGMENCQLF
jgi:hypothetical protein